MKTTVSTTKNNFGFRNFAKIIAKRQKEKNSDTFVIIYGPRRTGKTTLGFNILLPYMKVKRKQFAKGNTTWCIPPRWKTIFKDYFSADTEDVVQKLKNSPEESFLFIDEGIDVVSWQHMMEQAQKNLNEVILKAGKRKLLTILITPSMKLLTKSVLSNAHYLFLVPHEPLNGKNKTYLFRNHENPILRENIPFGFKSIEKDVLKNKFLSQQDNFKRYLKKQPCYITEMNYLPTNPKLYELYDLMVKEPLIMADKIKKGVVPLVKYKKLQYVLDTLLYNLHVGEQRKVSDIHRLMIDKFGFQLLSQPTIKKHLNTISSTHIHPDLPDEDLFDENIDEGKEKTDDSGIEELDCETDALE